MRRTRIGLVVVATLAVTLAVAPGATAKSRTEVEISSFSAGDPSQFQGLVDSPRKACKKGRRVKLYEAGPGEDAKVGSAKTVVGEGVYAFIIDVREVQAGKYYAEVEATRKCKGDRSPKYAVPTF